MLNGNSFVTYCVDMPQHADFGVTYTNYHRVDGATAFGAEKAQDLARLVTYVGLSPQYSTDSAMVQAAIWEVVHETGRNYSFTSGDVVATGLDASTQDWLDAFDWAAMRSTTAAFDVSALASATNQDFLITTPIPEPSTYALMALGLGLVGFAARRRTASAAAPVAAARATDAPPAA
ncbi:MAG: PEP-CTERM sorting domain-containing protein [Rubrivivax sp.]|nr:PEP-CTERM sorting domain-containing protein [Rubrivivax sp.]